MAHAAGNPPANLEDSGSETFKWKSAGPPAGQLDFHVTTEGITVDVPMSMNGVVGPGEKVVSRIDVDLHPNRLVILLAPGPWPGPPPNAARA